jgi:predicted RNA-binding protein
MCEANAYLRKGDQDVLVMKNVDHVEPQEGNLLLEDIFGQRKFLGAHIKELALVDHKIILEED